MLLVDTNTGAVRRIHIPDVSSMTSKLFGWMTSSSENQNEGQVRMVDGYPPGSSTVLLYHREGFVNIFLCKIFAFVANVFFFKTYFISAKVFCTLMCLMEL